MSYTAIDELDLIKANKIKLIEKINELLGVETNLTWTSTWTEIGEKIASLKTFLPEEDTEVHQEIDNFLQNIAIGTIKISSEKINEKTFYNKTSLEAITGKFVNTIEAGAFHNCTNLVSADFEKCATMADSAFNNCQKLSSLNLDFTNIITIPTYAFSNCNSLPIIKTTFPNLSIIYDYGFNACKKLVDLDWSKLTLIGSQSLRNCTGITSLDLSNCQATIGQYAFDNCTGLADVVIGERIGTISDYAFSNSGACDIYCELASQPTSWGTNWYGEHTVYWNAKLRDYTFVVNNGDENITLNRRVIKNDDLPTITRDGYEFDSWYLDQNFETELSCPYISTDKLNIYARWIRGFNLKIINIEDNFSETDVGTYYFNSIYDFKNSIGQFNCVGYYQSYENYTFSNMVTNIDTIDGVLPTLYIKATYIATRTEIHNYNYTGKVVETLLLPGKHKIECWGASGGQRSNATNATACTGGYAAGTLSLTDETLSYIYVGGAGSVGTRCDGGFNGGGAGCSTYGRTTTSGGGASDVRLYTDSLYSRLIVAGGGGGGHDSSTTPAGVSCGGGMYGIGGYSATYTEYNQNTDRCGAPGTQTNGGLGRSTTSWGTSATVNGIFGHGGYFTDSYYSTGGGGGWYGGGAGGPDGAAGGGSGYVYTSESVINYPDGCLLTSNNYLTEAELACGNININSPSGEIELGHTGNGYVRITSTIKGEQETTFNGCSVNLKGIYNNEIVNLNTILLMHNTHKNALETTFGGYINNSKEWYYDSECQEPIEEILEIATDNTSITIYCNVIEKLEHNFMYTGSVQSITLTPAMYKLECWGAEGGDCLNTSGQTILGGKGGYSVGTLTVADNTNVYLYVGGQGTRAQADHTATGGFNGGGSITDTSYSDSAVYPGSGGGASDIRIGTDSLYARVIVAGGGGGAASYSSSQTCSGMHGGGLNGLAGLGYDGGSLTGKAGGGSQTQGGLETGSYAGISGESGRFGFGGNGGTSSDKNSGAGGGGGWYGGCGGKTGNSNWNKPGGGGSGYVYTTETVANYPAGCLLNSSYYLTDANTVAGDTEFLAPDSTTETGHAGNGHIRITKIRS